MASVNINVGGAAYRFEADADQRTATVLECGFSICNPSAETVYVNFEGGTVTASDAAGASIPLKQGYTIPVPLDCKAFTFKTAANSAFPFWVSE